VAVAESLEAISYVISDWPQATPQPVSALGANARENMLEHHCCLMNALGMSFGSPLPCRHR